MTLKKSYVNANFMSVLCLPPPFRREYFTLEDIGTFLVRDLSL